jgi:hypothetical protein
VPLDVLEKLDRVAAAMDRPRSWFCLRAFLQYVAGKVPRSLMYRKGLRNWTASCCRRAQTDGCIAKPPISPKEASPQHGASWTGSRTPAASLLRLHGAEGPASFQGLGV